MVSSNKDITIKKVFCCREVTSHEPSTMSIVDLKYFFYSNCGGGQINLYIVMGVHTMYVYIDDYQGMLS